MVDPGVPGGQAGTSLRIRDYLGSRAGSSGSQLTTRVVEQAWLFGTEMLLAQRVESIWTEGVDRLLRTDQEVLRARAVVLAIGVDWRRLEVPSLDALSSAGAPATGPRGRRRRRWQGARGRGGRRPLRGAGRGAPRRHARSVTILIRRDFLAVSMSGLPDPGDRGPLCRYRTPAPSRVRRRRGQRPP